MKLSKYGVTVFMVVAVASVVLAVRHIRNTDMPRIAVSVRGLGDPDAQVKVIEFTDFQCPACAKASEIIHEQVKKDGDKIFLELKYFPLAMHKNARPAAVMAECASYQGKFWPMVDVLFRSQSNWGELASTDEYFLGLARRLGINEGKAVSCMASAQAKMSIDADEKQGRTMGVQATPTFFINGKMVVGVPNFQQALKDVLK